MLQARHPGTKNGYNRAIMKTAFRALGLALLGLALPFGAPAFADAPHHAYVGAQLIPFLHRVPRDSSFFTSMRTNGLAVRPYGGVRLRNLGALELGYAQYMDQDFPNSTGLFDDHYNFEVWDLSGKAFYPVNEQVEVFAQAGLAFVHRDIKNSILNNAAPIIDQEIQRTMPLLGLGLNIRISSHFTFNASLKQIIGVKGIGPIFNFPMGIAFHFI